MLPSTRSLVTRLAVPAAVFAAGVMLAAIAWAQSADVPMPRLAPKPGSVVNDPSALLKGANSVFAAPDTGGENTTSLTGTGGAGDIEADGTSGDAMDGAVPPSAEVALPEIDAGPPSDIRPGSFTLEARLDVDGPPLGDGVKWRIFGDKPGDNGRLPLLGEASGGIIYIRLDPGTYYVHAAYGRAGTTRKVEVTGPTGGEVLVLNAGGMRLLAVNGTDQPLGVSDVTFDIYAPDESGSEERYLLVPDAPPGKVISLNAGTYHVVCKYGKANAVVRADIKVDPGKLTEATVFQSAARLTLKLVEQHGGEAIADTAWTVMAQAGENVVLETVGAFPSMVLAAGDYTALARHDGKTFQLNFSVRPGENRDVEVVVE